MRFIFFIFAILILVSCSKPKTVLICGNHVCINKHEAEEYFKENLSIEVKIIKKKSKKTYDLVELNMQNNNEGKRKVSISHKKDTNKSLKILSKNEIEKIKKEIKLKKINKKTVKKETQIVKTQNLKSIKKNVNKEKINVVDVCTMLEKCSIDEISKYLIKIGKNKSFPDITLRQ